MYSGKTISSVPVSTLGPASSCRTSRNSATARQSTRHERRPQPSGQGSKRDRVFVDTFIRRPILATVCSLVIVLAGALAIPSMPIAQFPDVAPPTVSVLAVYTGANAETVETAV